MVVGVVLSVCNDVHQFCFVPASDNASGVDLELALSLRLRQQGSTPGA
jgi:hypothetical protein